MKGRIYKTIPAELVSAAEGGVVVSADGVYDYLLEKNLETINGEKANTSDLAAIAFSGSYSDLSDTPTIPEIPHNVSSFNNDVGYLTQHLPLKTINGENLIGTGNIEIIGGGGGSSEPLIQSDWNLTDNSAVDYIKNKPSIPTIPSNISAFNNDAGYLTLHLDISGKADKSTLARVATTGSYNDLTNTPITPTITVLSVTDGYLITIIDLNNPSGLSFTIMNGANGSNGVNGTDGITPHIDLSTGNWFIGSTNTGVRAQGTLGAKGDPMPSIYGNNNLRDWAADFIFNNASGETSCLITDDFSYNWTIQDNGTSHNYQGQVHAGDVVTVDASNTQDLVISYNIIGLSGTNGTDGTNGADGQDGKSLEFNWSGTQLGVRVEGDPSYTYVDLKGNSGLDGQNGTNGVDGQDGQDGVSPVVTIASITGGHSVTITDAEHLNGQTFNVMDGANGTNGINGTNGLDGITPHIDATTKHWMIGTTDTGVIAEGQNGSDGTNGTNGTNGTDGVTPHIDSTTGNWFIGTTDTGVHAQGPAGQDGLNGSNGTNGTNGTDGISPAVTIATISGGHSVTITDADHPSGQSFNVMDGTLANQIQADWNLTTDSAPDYIKNKPTIPAEVTETTVAGWGFTKNTGNSNFSGSYNDLTDKPSIPTKTSDLTNDSGYLTQHQSLTNYATKTFVSDKIAEVVGAAPETLDTLEEIADALSNTATMETVSAAISTKANAADLAPVATSGSYTDLLDTPNIPTVPTNVSSFTNDANYITGMVILSYGSSTWNDFISAYNANKVVYCRAASGSDPASGSQTRLAFMAYVNNASSPTEVEFLYYRSVSSHSDNQLGDQVFVYKLVSNGAWTVTTRNAFTKIAAGTNMTGSYSNGTLTLNASTPDLTSYATESWVLQLGYLTQHQSLSDYYTKSLIDSLQLEQNTAIQSKASQSTTYTKTEVDGLLSQKANTTDLSTVATTGSYNDLSDTPSDISEFNNDSEYVSYDKVTLENSSMFLKSAGDGIATINNIKGNTVVWNQLIRTDLRNYTNSETDTRDYFAMLALWYNGTSVIGAWQPSIISSGRNRNITRSDTNSNAMRIKHNGGVLDLDLVGRLLCPIIGGHQIYISFTVVSADPTTVGGLVVNDIFAVDLTLIYGEGNEPTTAAQFEADYERWFGKPLTYEPYDAGSLRPVLMSGIKTTGFNQWDEEWENNSRLNYSTGEVIPDAYSIVSKNFIPVLPNTVYYVKSPTTDFNRIAYYDANKQYLGGTTGGWDDFEEEIHTPNNAYYCRFCVKTTTYNHDICINISNQSKNDTYEPYEEHIKTLDITTLKGKLNGSGNSVTVFPDGLKKAGSVYDEIKAEGGVVKAIKRVGSLDLGTLNWHLNNGVMYADVYDGKLTSYPLELNNVDAKYNTVIYTWFNITNKTQSFGEQINNTGIPCIAIRDDDYSDTNTFKTAMNGVMLYYELATPQEYILDDISVPINYYVDLYGTEELIQQSNGVAATIVTTYNGELGKDLSKILLQSAITGDKVATDSDITQLFSDNGYEYVDLGLPSGLLWATCNVGASSPTEHGLYFSWGNVEGHAEGSGYNFSDAVYAETSGSALTEDIPTNSTYDAVLYNMGGLWRMPTKNEFLELYNNCDSEWTTVDGVVGRRFTSRINGNSIFFPASGYYNGTSLNGRGSYGYYWSSSYNSATKAYNLYFNSSNVYPANSEYRRLGFTARAVLPNPVSDPSKIVKLGLLNTYKLYIATTSDIPSTTGMVTSTTTGLKIEVVSSLPATPDSNTIYIVQSA